MSALNEYENMSEALLLRALCKNDRYALEFIFRKYFRPLCVFANHFVKDRQISENIVGDFFCSLWENASNLNINNSLKGYLYKSIFNSCLKHQRHIKVVEKYINEKKSSYNKSPLNYSNNPENDIVAAELDGKLTKAINMLPEQCKNIFILNRFENLSLQEIADKLSVSLSTVKTQLGRAINKLKLEFRDYFFFL